MKTRRSLAPAARLGLLLCLGAAFCAPPVAAANPPASFFGIAPQQTLTDADAARMSRGGIGMVRLPVAWSVIQPTRDGGYDWTVLDVQVERAARAKLAVLPVLYHAPAWATGDSARLPVRTAAQRTAWMRFLAAAVQRYGPGGEFWESPLPLPLPGDAPVAIRQWQIWNEENFFYFTKPASPGLYARLLKISSRAIKRADPRARVLLGGLFGRPKERPPKAMGAATFLTRLYRVRGIRRSFDGVALHPYAPNTRTFKRLTEGVRRVMRRNRDGSTGLYITEMGWGSDTDRQSSFEKGPRGQARQLRSAYRYMIRNRRRLNLKGVYWFSWKDIPSSPCNYCDSVGLFREGSDYRAKPAWYAFVSFTGGSPDPPPIVPLRQELR